MAHITVSTKILGGNLEDGWAGNHDAALALADLMRKRWTSDLSEFTEEGHTLAFEIDVEREATGCDCGQTVFVTIGDPKDRDEAYRLELYSTEALTCEDELWAEFRANPPASAGKPAQG